MNMKKNKKISMIINIVFILVFSFITIGYAAYNQELGVTSSLSLVGNGELYFTNNK